MWPAGAGAGCCWSVIGPVGQLAATGPAGSLGRPPGGRYYPLAARWSHRGEFRESINHVGVNMAEKMTMKSLSADLEALQKKVSQLERQLNRKIESTVKKALDEAMQKAVVAPGKESPGPGVDAAERQRLIAEAAYLMAEQRGFEKGDPAQDWVNAEEEVNRVLLQGNSS